MRDPFSLMCRPSSTQEIRASGLLFDVVHSSDMVSFTLASLGPTIFTFFGATVVNNKDFLDPIVFKSEIFSFYSHALRCAETIRIQNNCVVR